MERRNITPLIETVKKVVESHKLSKGRYTRFRVSDSNNQPDEYGCADAANLLYTIGAFPRDVEERKLWIETLQNMQSPETGLFQDETHCPFHTTAHCAAALENFDAPLKYKIADMEKYKSKEALYAFLESLDWEEAWSNSHYGAGLYAALHIAGEATPEWEQWYFEWFWNQADPETGLWRNGYPDINQRRIYRHMAGTFHYLFNHEHAKMPLHYPEKLIDTCLDMYEKKHLPTTFGRKASFIEVDWVFCVTRALRQCGHRYEECKNALLDFADGYLDFLMSVDPDSSDEFDDLHALFGAMCCVAELQQFLRGYIYTEKPLKLVLDRRPFI